MAKRVTPRTKFSSRNMIAVLRGEKYDDELIAIAVVELRSKGLRVQVVSLTKKTGIPGEWNMDFTADLDLTQMYASINQIRYVLLPTYTITSEVVSYGLTPVAQPV